MPISEDVIEILHRVQKLEKPGKFIFPVRYHTYNDKVKAAAEFAGCKKEDFHTHCLRATRITNIFNKTGNIVVAQKLARHTTSAMTRKYIKDAEAKAMMEDIMSENLYSTPTQHLFEEEKPRKS